MTRDVSVGPGRAQTLDPLSLPLQGNQLVEASAGTGKTYTIATLVLRLLLGHGGRPPLAIDQILVVTFTEAATAELADRIRDRVRDARDLLLHEADTRRNTAGTDVTALLLADLQAAGANRQELVRLLEAALARMDEAAICTIHGFCRRMLRDSAFETGSLFELEYIRDDSRYRQAAAADTWRRLCYSGAGAEGHACAGDGGEDGAVLAQQLLATPAKLLQRVGSWLQHPDMAVEGGPDLPLADELVQLRAVLDLARNLWRADDLAGVLAGAGYRVAEKCPGRPAHLADLAGLMAASGAAALAGIDTKLLTRVYSSDVLLNPGMMRGKATVPVAATDFAQAMDQAGHALARVQGAILLAAWQGVEQGLEQALAAAATLAPDALLRRMAAALAGPAGARLALRARRLFPAAMIDEFQDTDSLQFGIFHRIYRQEQSEVGGPGAEETGARNNSTMAHCLLMIGDPKQAIYSFRGADIYAYLWARDGLTANQRWTLDTNFRSAQPVLDGLQALYGQAQDPFLTEGVGFEPVHCGLAADPKKLHLAGRQAPGLTFAWLPPPGTEPDSARSGTDAELALADHAATQVVQLLASGLRLGNGGGAGGQPDDPPLRAADLCVLVRSHIQAEQVRRALTARGVPSVYLSRAPVLATAVARDMLALLVAVLEPRDERHIRSALASGLFDLPVASLAARFADARAWPREQARFTDYQQLWRERGVLAMIRQVLADYQVPQRLLQRPGGLGERRLTDIRHLGELLQEQAGSLDSDHALLHWLRDAVAAGGDDAVDDQQLRLDTDANLVQVATVHAAKGLEYNLVLLPFACLQVPRDLSGTEQLVHRQQGDRWQAVLALQADQDTCDRAWQELVAEELRLLYVALTRARHSCVVSVTPVHNKRGGSARTRARYRQSALGVLLHGFAPHAGSPDQDSILAVLDHLAASCSAVQVQRALPPQVARQKQQLTSGDLSLDADSPDAALAARIFNRRLVRHWGVSSYSALVAGHDAHAALAPLPGAADEQRDPVAETPAPTGMAADFPRGPVPGTCLHQILELHHSHQGAAGEPLAEELVARQLAEFGLSRLLPGSDPAQPVWAGAEPGLVCRWLNRVLTLPLPPLAVSLAEVMAQPGAAVSELEFHLAVADADLDAVCALLDELGFNSAPLASRNLRGLLKGFIDLVFEHQGKLWVVDYKSNWLGPGPSTAASMDLAMAQHRYDLQALLYAVAMHRWLQGRPVQFGGVLYLFLRGMDLDGRDPSAGIWHYQPSLATLKRLDALLAPGGAA